MTAINEFLNNGIGAELQYEFPMRLGRGAFHANVLNGQNVLVGGRVVDGQMQMRIITEIPPFVDRVIELARTLRDRSIANGEDLPDPIQAAENIVRQLNMARQQTENNTNSSTTTMCSAVAWGTAAIVCAVAFKVFANI